MLVELRIRDFAVVEDLTLQLGPGLNVLTGETGAGKSIIVDALSLLLGERASSDDVRSGRDRALVEAVFDLANFPDLVQRLDDLGLPADDDHLILRREVQAHGRNRAWVNGSPATATVVGELGSRLVDLHGQHEHQTLLDRNAQRVFLDAYAGSGAVVAEVKLAHTTWAASRQKLETHRERVRELERQADFLRFQHAEIRDAELDLDEEAELERDARRLEHARELGEDAQKLAWGLTGGDEPVLDRIAELRGLARRLAELDESTADLLGALENAWQTLSAAASDADAYAEGIDLDPARLEEVQRRKDLLFRLKRKYGPELSDVVDTGARLQAEVEQLDAADRDLTSLQAEVETREAVLRDAATRLTAARVDAAERFQTAVNDVFPALGMPDARLEIALRPLDAPGTSGAESVEFECAMNSGFAVRPLSKVASGGELSRIMLALKAVLAEVDAVPTLIFDEIDAGIGGVVATGVAAKLAEVALNHQVFVITHLPQLASRACAHLLVEKQSGSGLVSTSVVTLQGEDRVREIARMLGGDPESATSRDHARELLQTG